MENELLVIIKDIKMIKNMKARFHITFEILDDETKTPSGQLLETNIMIKNKPVISSFLKCFVEKAKDIKKSDDILNKVGKIVKEDGKNITYIAK